MIELLQLKQLVAFAEYGTLSKAAEMLHISQPTLTRTMQKLENEFDVLLFHRTKNKMELNENGKLAVIYANKILDQTKDMINLIRANDRTNHTLFVGSCAPMPMITLIQEITQRRPNITISTELKENEMLLKGLNNGTYQIIILPYKPEQKDIYIKEYGTEKLFFALPFDHSLAKKDAVFMEELDGENMLLYFDIGFWREIPAKKMPHSRFLVQNDEFALKELVELSILPSFVTDVAIRLQGAPNNRKIVPILDEEATVNYYVVCLKTSNNTIQQLIYN